MKYFLFPFVIFFFNMGCESENVKTIKLSEYKEYSLIKPQTEITLLKSFISNKNCDDRQGIFYANAFLCKIDGTNDTIIVFNICKKPYEFLKNNYKGSRWLVINSSKVIKNHPDQVLANIDQLTLAKKYKYIVAEINNLED